MSTLKCRKCGKDADEVAAVHGMKCRCGGIFCYPARSWDDDPFAVSSWKTIEKLTEKTLTRPEQHVAFIEAMERK